MFDRKKGKLHEINLAAKALQNNLELYDIADPIMQDKEGQQPVNFTEIPKQGEHLRQICSYMEQQYSQIDLSSVVLIQLTLQLHVLLFLL